MVSTPEKKRRQLRRLRPIDNPKDGGSDDALSLSKPERLRLACERMFLPRWGMTTVLSTRSKVDQSYISKLLREEDAWEQVGLRIVQQIAKTLMVPVSWLIGEIDDQEMTAWRVRRGMRPPKEGYADRPQTDSDLKKERLR